MNEDQRTIVGGLISCVLVGMLIPATRYLCVAIAGVGIIVSVLVMHAQGAKW